MAGDQRARATTGPILICTGAFLPPVDPWLERAAAVRGAGATEVIADAVVGRWFTELFAETHPDTVSRHRAMISATDPGGYAACCAGDRHDGPARWASSGDNPDARAVRRPGSVDRPIARPD